MRILLISDIHSNWAALSAIREPFDLCLCMGDLVDYGVEPAPVIDWVRRNAAVCMRGNHDHSVAQNVVTVGSGGFRYLSGVTRSISRSRIAETDRRFLASLPVTRHLSLDGRRFLLVHATPRDPLDEYANADVEFWKRRLDGIEADIVCVGHTHQPYLLNVGDTLVVNPGSVGLPRDGDPRASYAIYENGEVILRRVEYPIQTTIDAVECSPLPELAKEMLVRAYRQGTLGNGWKNGTNGNHEPPAVAVNGLRSPTS
jgi:putative phosphoesterase